MDEIQANRGNIKWAENATLGYCPQDSTADFDSDLNLYDWMSRRRKPSHDDQVAPRLSDVNLIRE